MPAKNAGAFLVECLESILHQTFQNWELLAVNDHSEDDTLHILKTYFGKDPRIEVYEAEKPNLIPALQKGYANSSGDLITRMDADDKMPANKLELMVAKWQEMGSGHVISGKTEHFRVDQPLGDGFKKYDAWLANLVDESRHYQEIYQECVIPSNGWLVHRDDFNKTSAFDPFTFPEDYDLCFRFYEAGLKVVGLDAVVHHWRDHSDRISRNKEEYRDNRFFNLKTHYFLKLDRSLDRELVLWGAGRNGKDLAKILVHQNVNFQWVCNNQNKIGRDIYGVRLQSTEAITTMQNPQIMIVITSPKEREEVKVQLQNWGMEPKDDYWFFC